MKYEEKLKQIKSDGMIASWEFPQEEWNKIAKKYKNQSWKILLFIAAIPIIVIIAILEYYYIDLSLLYRGFIFIRVMSATILFAFLYLLFFFIWLNKIIFPKPRKNSMPRVIISKNGVLIGNSFLFWNKKFKLFDVNLITESESRVYIELTIVWLLGSGKINIPIPSGKLSEAQVVVNILSKEKIKKTMGA